MPGDHIAVDERVEVVLMRDGVLADARARDGVALPLRIDLAVDGTEGLADVFAVPFAGVEVGDAADAEGVDEIMFVFAFDLIGIADLGGAVPSFDDGDVRVELSQPSRSYIEWNGCGFGAVVDDDCDALHLCEGCLDHILVSAMQWGVFAECESMGYWLHDVDLLCCDAEALREQRFGITCEACWYTRCGSVATGAEQFADVVVDHAAVDAFIGQEAENRDQKVLDITGREDGFKQFWFAPAPQLVVEQGGERGGDWATERAPDVLLRRDIVVVITSDRHHIPFDIIHRRFCEPRRDDVPDDVH